MITKEKSPEAPPRDVHRGGAFFIVITALILAIFTGGIAYGVQTMIGRGGKPAEGMMMGGVRMFDISVQEWSFNPAVIKVNPGEKVQFVVTSKDVWHGFAINELNINLTIPSEKTVTKDAVIPADVADGVYTMYCSVFCGLGHPYLKGQVIVGNPKLFLGVGLGRILPYMATLAMAAVFTVVILIGRRKAR